MKFLLPLSLLALATCLSLHAETLTYRDLAGRLSSLQHLATPPPSGEQGALESSYDRHSRYDAVHDKYIEWDANSDGDFGGAALTPMDGDRIVMADIKGPGCIWRMWSATLDQGHVKIYLDGSAMPAVDLPWKGYFDGQHEPFTRAHLVYEAAMGFNNYTPIPFQKSCRILADKGWGLYFHFNYTRFAPGTKVPTFQLPLSAEDSAALDAANTTLGKCGDDPAGARPLAKTESVDVTVPAGKKSVVAELKGPQAITAIRLKFAPGQMPADLEAQRALLRQLALCITWDGQKEPAVWSPFGDFFGSGSGGVPHRNLPSGLTEDGTWYSYWYMPFGTSARIALDNDSARDVSLHGEIVHAPLEQPAASLLRFHAKWHRDAFLNTRPDRPIDWPMLTTQGRGRFVGTQLHVWNPCCGWWGEGDEKFFVDGEKFPSTFGTGSEDYFGYAWASNQLFTRAFHSQTTNEDNNQGNVSVNRWHLADNVPFQTSFIGDLEKYFFNQRPCLFADTVFWYLSADGHDPYQPVPVKERTGYWLEPFVYHEPHSTEGEALPVLGKPGHAPQIQDMTAFVAALRHTPGDRNWGDNKQLYWPAQEVGERLELGFQAKHSRKYRLMLHATTGPEYGIVQLEVDGRKWGAPQDQYSDTVRPGGMSFEILDLKAGPHILGVVITGKNASSSGHAFGLDYIKVMPDF